ncbi:MAG: hypothetical protein WC089_02590 [Candidatus Paceibacterota bacterium]
MKKNNYNKGIGAIEILISIAILAVITAVVMPSLSSFKNHQVLVNTAEDVVSLLNKARMETLASKNSNYYSVHFETNRAVLFTGGVFNRSDSNNYVVNFDSAVSIPSSGGINLTGGGANVTFTRLTGDTNQNGNIVLQLNSDNNQKKIITIKKTGVSSSN